MRLRLSRRPPVAAGLVAAVLCVLAACGTGPAPAPAGPPAPTTGPSTTAASTVLCADLAELTSSLDGLTKVKPAEDGVAALETAIADVRGDLTAVEASASDALRPSVDQVKTAFADLRTAAAGLTPENRREKAPGIATALRQVGTATAGLSSAVNQSCPGR